MFCSQCGRQLADTDVYCGWCGHAARGAPVAARPQPARPAADLPPSLAYEAPRPRTAGGRWVADLVANRFSIFGLMCGVTALYVVPIVFGPVGLILAAIGMSKNEEKAVAALIVTGLGMVAGLVTAGS